MRTLRLCTGSRPAALAGVLAALLALPVALAGCGGVGVSGAATAVGSQLTVYSSLPLQGPSGAASQQIVNGEKLALAGVGGRVGAFKVSYVSEDDSSPTNGKWAPGVTASNAKTAADDTTTIAYLGDYDSAATAVSLPLINAAGILQVSPASPYVGLTSSRDAGQDEPERFYPTGRRTFARLQPGDPAQAAAQAKLMASLGVHKVYILNDQDPFQVPLAQITAGDAERSGIAVAGDDGLNVTDSTTFTSEVEKISKSGAQAVFFAGGTEAGTVALWQQLHNADPGLLLLGSSTLADGSFTAQLGAAGANTYITTPVLAPGLYPPGSARVLADYRRVFGGEPGGYALYGYEAMSVVLDAIRRAGPHGNDRESVIDQLFAVSNRDSALGRYSIEADGETTLGPYGVDRVQNGQPVFYRAIHVG
jgi:branched-chain amino acid transport system substrate-binding protein